MASPSLKLCMPSPMMTIQAMLAIPASFISWSEWQFPPWECPWECPWPCCLTLRPFSLTGDGWSCWGLVCVSGVLLVGDSLRVWSSLSCVSLWPLSQETTVLSGSERKKERRRSKRLRLTRCEGRTTLNSSYLRWEASGAATPHQSADSACDLTTSCQFCPPRSPSSCSDSRNTIFIIMHPQKKTNLQIMTNCSRHYPIYHLYVGYIYFTLWSL